ncbi:MAG: chorismate lyase [Rhodoferax sp.]|jgi:chorismate--pyruvate lyase|nr:chorismate lyase [Rhodoferax sp.]
MTRWSQRNPVRGKLRRWLQAPGSLSARLAATGERFTVQVLNQRRQSLTVDEARALGSAGGRAGYAREVLLRVDDVPLVFARSVTRHVDSVGAWRSLRGLGSRPLADVLFNRAGMVRSQLAFARLAQGSRLQRHVQACWQAATGQRSVRAAFPARRSVFVWHGAALLVMEVFVADTINWSGQPKNTR